MSLQLVLGPEKYSRFLQALCFQPPGALISEALSSMGAATAVALFFDVFFELMLKYIARNQFGPNGKQEDEAAFGKDERR